MMAVKTSLKKKPVVFRASPELYEAITNYTDHVERYEPRSVSNKIQYLLRIALGLTLANMTVLENIRQCADERIRRRAEKERENRTQLRLVK